jgi:N-methylhydantoinase B
MMTLPAATPGTSQKIEPFLLSVISQRLSAIVREMNATLMKSSRSAVIKNAKDFSCGLVTYDHRLLTVEDSIPIHVSALNLGTKPITAFFDDVSEGDAYLNNCPYTGNTHHADMTLCVPVFCDGEPLFWSVSRAHHADIGAPVPTTYLPLARTIYEEGVHLPCVRSHEKYRERNDIMRMCKMKIRVPELWYGDFQAQVGACRVGERRLKELAHRYGRDTIKAFVEEWMAYGERRMIAEIATLPRGEWSFETRHDPVPDVADKGIPVKVTVRVDPDEGRITVDARDNVDCVPGGLNLTEATALASCRIGVFYNLDPGIPHNEGSASRIEVLLRDNCVVGRPQYPVGTSVATTNMTSRLISAVASCFSQMGPTYGMAEIAYSQALGEAVISGRSGAGAGEEYVNQIFLGYGGGAGSCGYDGWLLSGAGCDGGQMLVDSVEINEGMYPILVEGRNVAVDSGGPGTWDGAPGIEGRYRPLSGKMTVYWGSDGDVNAPRGVRGGGDAANSGNWLIDKDGGKSALVPFGDVTIGPGQSVAFRACGGGGYGNPAERDPDRVLRSVRRGWVSPERAETLHRVALKPVEDARQWIVDSEATARLRAGDRGTAR